MADNEKPKDKQHEDVQELATWRKKIEMIGIDIKSLDRESETGRLLLRTTFMNQHHKDICRKYLYSWIHSVIGVKIYQNVSRIAENP
jgi:hypothetical protein